jgi:hypothetical protein
MRVVRVGPLPEAALEAAAEFHARVLPEVLGASRLADPPPVGEDLAIVFQSAPHDHRGWRLAAVQDLARAGAPARVNGVVGGDEQAIADTIAYLEQSPGVTGQLLAVEPG